MESSSTHPAMAMLEEGGADGWVVETIKVALEAGAVRWTADPEHPGVWGLQAANIPDSDRAFAVVYPAGTFGEGTLPDFEFDEFAMEIIHRTAALPDGVRD